MYGAAFSIVKNEDDAQDVVHNVVCKLLTLELSKFPRTYELTWLYKVIKNEALSLLSENRYKVSIDNMLIEPIIKDKNINDFVDMENYYSMIKDLNEEAQEVITLKIIGGYTHKEIAQILNKPIGTIQRIYNRSIKKLRLILSSVMFTIILIFSGIISHSIIYINKINLAPESSSGEIVTNWFIYSMIVLVIIFIVLISAFIFIFTNSDKIPTKPERKNI